MKPTKSVQQSLKALEDKRAILNTLHAYGHCLDYGDEEGFMDCWTAGPQTPCWVGRCLQDR